VAKTCPNVVFQIVGGGDTTPYRKLAAACGIADCVQFLGTLEDIPNFLAQLDVAVLPSRAEGLPNSLLEYMAAGRPIVATAVGGISDLIDNENQGLLVAAENPQELAKAQIRLLENPSLSDSLSYAVQHKAASAYSSTTMAQRYELFYHKLFSSNNNKSSDEIEAINSD
jgi:L-malate glycosyltransferase